MQADLRYFGLYQNCQDKDLWKREHEDGEIVRQKGDDQGRDPGGEFVTITNLIAIAVKILLSNRTLYNNGNVLSMSCPRW